MHRPAAPRELEMACRSKSPAKALSARIKTRHQVGATRKTHLVARCWYACFPSLFNTKWLESLQEILCYTILGSGYIIVKYRLPAGTQATVYIYLIMLFQEEVRYLPIQSDAAWYHSSGDVCMLG